jgi:predicted phage tail protein
MPKDTLSSVQVLRVIDLLSEGIIEGFPSTAGLNRASEGYKVAALKDIFFNNTPILGQSASVSQNSKITDANIVEQLNFDMSDSIIQINRGRQDQSFLDNVGDLNQRTFAVNVELQRAPRVGNNEGSFAADGTPVTRQITDTDVNQIRVTVGSPAISKFKKNGDVDGVKIKYKIEVRYSGGSFQQVDSEHVIDGFTPDLYQRRHLIVLDPDESFPVDIRLTRTFQRYDDDDTINDDLVWYDYTEKIKETTRFPNSALVGFKINAEQFPSVPERSYKIRGIKVRIPHNATVRSDGSLSYSSDVFNGTLKADREWCNDPAFILFDLLSNTRYGLGSQILTPAEFKLDQAGGFFGPTSIPSNLDIYSFQQASAYCGELVADGKGGTEPRFSCNILLQTQQDAYKLIQEMCSVFRAMSYWESGKLTFAQDRPEDFAYQFNQTNVTDAGFSYSGSSLRNRPTCVAVKYFDNDLRNHAQELVELNSTSFKPLQKYGYNKHSVTAFACTSRGQARRLGLWLLYTEHNESEVCSFETDMAAGIIVRPGDFIKVADPVRAGKTVGGRVIDGSTTTSVKIDRSDVDMFGQQTPSTFTLNIVLRDGTMQVVKGSTISGNTITPGSTLNKAPLTGAPFAIGYTDLTLQLFRVVTVEENESTYSVTALAHEREKYAVVEEGHTFAPRDITQLAEKPAAVTNLALTEVLYEVGDKVLQRVNVNWQQSTRANEYEVVFKLDDNNPEKHTVTTTGFEIQNSNIGTYEVSVTAIGYGLDVAQTGKRRSSATTATINTVGKSNPPSNIASLNITPIDQHTAELHWPEAVDLDVKIGGTVEIRHNPRTTGELSGLKVKRSSLL